MQFILQTIVQIICTNFVQISTNIFANLQFFILIFANLLTQKCKNSARPHKVGGLLEHLVIKEFK